MNYISPPAIEATFGSKGAEQVLLYLQNYGEGYAKGIADTFEMSVSQVQNQLKKFENSGLLVSRLVGSVRLYTWNPINPTARHLRKFLQLLLDDLPQDTTQGFFRERRRPRRPGKRIA